MRTVFFPLLLAAFIRSAHAQSYAPETDFHDPSQRFFVPEAARVLAWRENLASNQIAEITYEVSTTNQNTLWKIEWRDKAGKTVKSANVQYPATKLKEGADFYRQAFRQLWAANWHPLDSTTPADIEAGFWTGADNANVSREASLMAAFALGNAMDVKSGAVPAAQLAGVLVHSTLPGAVSGRLTLDSVLMARAAAWLALAEQSSPKPVNRPWSALLFSAGREQAASATWSKETATAATTNGIVEAWALWLRRPTSKEVYKMAIGTRQPMMAMAMLVYDAQAYNNSSLLSECMESLAGSPAKIAALHNYAPFFARKGSIGGGHMMEGAPAIQRRAWLEVLEQCPKDPSENVDFSKELQAAKNRSVTPSPDEDDCLSGFREAVPLIKLGQSQGIGKLTPVSVVSPRDLLNYGWEATGQQMGSRYKFVNSRWGVREQAKPIADIVTGEVPGLRPFFFNAQQSGSYNYQDDLLRLQCVEGFYQLTGWSPNPYCHGQGGGSAWLFTRRCWLRCLDYEWQVRSLSDDNEIPRMDELGEAFRNEAGPLAGAQVLRYLGSVGDNATYPPSHFADFAAALAESTAEPTRVTVRVLWAKKYKPMSCLERARALEKLYWANVDGGLEDWVVRYYCLAGEFKSARRFYLQARENFTDSVHVSNGIGQMAFVLGYVLNDAPLRQKALDDSASGSSDDMMMHIWEEAIRDNRTNIEKLDREMVERYEADSGSNSIGHRLQRFLPLLPALTDVKDPHHHAALHYFDNFQGWRVLRWIWTQEFNLPKEDGVALMGGPEAGGFLQVLVRYLQGDAAQTTAAMKDLVEKDNDETQYQILASYFALKQAGQKLDAESPDLKPADAQSIRKLVQSQ